MPLGALGESQTEVVSPLHSGFGLPVVLDEQPNQLSLSSLLGRGLTPRFAITLGGYRTQTARDGKSRALMFAVEAVPYRENGTAPGSYELE